jgi:NTP pyrophosphatase (non-canonical NTP hydrolase)
MDVSTSEQSVLVTSRHDQIVAAVADRGYLKGWTDQELAARQICKLTEELGELAKVIEGGKGRWLPGLFVASEEARKVFDKGYLGEVCPEVAAKAIKELADCMVVIHVLADALSSISGVPIDLDQIALEKATRDIGRGVR